MLDSDFAVMQRNSSGEMLIRAEPKEKRMKNGKLRMTVVFEMEICEETKEQAYPNCETIEEIAELQAKWYADGSSDLISDLCGSDNYTTRVEPMKEDQDE